MKKFTSLVSLATLFLIGLMPSQAFGQQTETYDFQAYSNNNDVTNAASLSWNQISYSLTKSATFTISGKSYDCYPVSFTRATETPLDFYNRFSFSTDNATTPNKWMLSCKKTASPYDPYGLNSGATKNIVVMGIHNLKEGDNIQFYNDNTTASGKTGFRFYVGQNLSLNGADVAAGTALAKSKYTVTQNGDAFIYYNGGGSYAYGGTITKIEVTRTTETLKVGTAGYATFSSDFPIDLSSLSNKSITAYVASGFNASTQQITFSPASGIIPARTGLLLKGTVGTAIEGTVNVATEAGTAPSDALVAVTSATTINATDATSGKTNLVLMNGADGKSGPVGFYKVGTTFEVSVNTAYLSLSGVSGANSFYGINTGNETTGISEVSPVAKNTAKYYSLTGVEATHPTKGIYIQNGKKVVVK